MGLILQAKRVGQKANEQQKDIYFRGYVRPTWVATKTNHKIFKRKKNSQVSKKL